MVKKLEDKGFTYEIPGDGIYFDTSKDPHYGELARLKLDQQLEGARIGITEGKRNPSDFALWKFYPVGEKHGDGMGFTVGQRFSRLAYRVFSDEYQVSGRTVCDPHRWH